MTDSIVVFEKIRRSIKPSNVTRTKRMAILEKDADQPRKTKLFAQPVFPMNLSCVLHILRVVMTFFRKLVNILHDFLQELQIQNNLLF